MAMHLAIRAMPPFPSTFFTRNVCSYSLHYTIVWLVVLFAVWGSQHPTPSPYSFRPFLDYVAQCARSVGARIIILWVPCNRTSAERTFFSAQFFKALLSRLYLLVLCYDLCNLFLLFLIETYWQQENQIRSSQNIINILVAVLFL